MFSYKIMADADLRLLEERHAEAFFAVLTENREHIQEWMTWADPIKSVEDAREFIRSGLEKFIRRKGMEAGIWYQDRLAGVISYNSIDPANRKAAIGYWIDHACQGRGLATAACRAMVDYAFTELKLNRVELECATGNLKSQRIPEKLGFRKEGLIRQPEWLHTRFVDHFLYGLLAAEWAAAEREGHSLAPEKTI